jgi:hypothetical protein
MGWHWSLPLVRDKSGPVSKNARKETRNLPTGERTKNSSWRVRGCNGVAYTLTQHLRKQYAQIKRSSSYISPSFPDHCETEARPDSILISSGEDIVRTVTKILVQGSSCWASRTVSVRRRKAGAIQGSWTDGFRWVRSGKLHFADFLSNDSAAELRWRDAMRRRRWCGWSGVRVRIPCSGARLDGERTLECCVVKIRLAAYVVTRHARLDDVRERG